MNNPIKKVVIIGGGAMGGGFAARIARDAGNQGVRTVIIEHPDRVDAARQSFYERIHRWFKLGHIPFARVEELVSYVTFTGNPADAADADFFLECVPENLELKQEIFRTYDAILRPGVIMASNTSSRLIGDIAQATNRPELVVGFHGMQPPTSRPLLEVIRSSMTSDETVETVTNFAEGPLKMVTILSKDSPLAIVNRQLLVILDEVYHWLEHSNVNTLDIDEANKDWPAGFVTLSNFLGLDVVLEVGKNGKVAYPDRVVMGDLIPEMVKHGLVGKKNGEACEGFYALDPEEGSAFENLRNELFSDFQIARRHDITGAMVYEYAMLRGMNEAALILEEGVASKSDIERGTVVGLGIKNEGLLHAADAYGINRLVVALTKLESKHGMRFHPAKILVDMTKSDGTFFGDEL